MKYRVLGRRVLLKVIKYNKETKIEGSMLYMPETESDAYTATQTIGEVVGLGELAFLNDDGSKLGNQEAPVKLGDKVHFQRYGAVRLNPKLHKDEEYWVIEDKDMYAVDLIENATKKKEEKKTKEKVKVNE